MIYITLHAAQFFNGPFFPPHMMPSLPQIQAASGLKQQQGMGTLQPQSTSTQQQQQQLQLQLAPQSPSQFPQQHGHVGTPPHLGERESTMSVEAHSTADSRLSAMQRGISDPGPNNLPNLNMSPATASNMPTMHSHEQDVSLMASSGVIKQNSKPQQQVQFHSQGQGLSMQQQHYMQTNAGSGSGLQINQPSQGYPAITISGASRNKWNVRTCACSSYDDFTWINARNCGNPEDSCPATTKLWKSQHPIPKDQLERPHYQ